ncbi:MAG: Chemotaxis protein methyltransferase Cher2 [Syntrophorhabdaceae bacterium PtaU1.Bin034]|nr:MAG: Chemotaxis protein methyltransferase Cher2 [Syntrophorhabdaceae bacterium PtaU1.Bin034]
MPSSKMKSGAQPNKRAAKDNTIEQQKSRAGVRAFYIAGIGASAGGLETLQEFLKNVPDNSGIGYVIVAHLAPDCKSVMAELLQKHSKMKVYEAEDQMQVMPNCVYVIPAGKEMAILKGCLQLMQPRAEKGVSYPIDFFFRSLAKDQADYGIGIILSGTGTDGTQGIKDIKNERGLVIVQDSEDARYTGMPISAAETGIADYIIPVRKIPKHVFDYVRHARILQVKRINKKDMTSDYLKKMLVLIRNEVGFDFTLYKPDHLIRGIQKQMSMHRIGSIEDYLRFLRANPDEMNLLARVLLIKVTRFFRDESAFEILKSKAFSLIAKGKDKKNPLRVWVPGCSTGEEAYSIAMVLREFMEEMQGRFAVQIFATDIDDSLIETARSGLYPAGIAEDVSPERLERFFIRMGPDYKVKDEIRSMVIFAVQDLVKGPTFMKLDLISCRNVLIYMGSQLQKRIIPLFHYCLNRQGILFLGTSETIGDFGNLFSAVDGKARVFQAKNVPSPPLPRAMRGIQMPENPRARSTTGSVSLEEESFGTLLDRALDRLSSGGVNETVAASIRDAMDRIAASTEAPVTKENGTPAKKPLSQKDRDRLEAELKRTKEKLQTTIEELETSNEELRSSNEELESVNEELLSLNAEFQNKIDELADAQANMDILLGGAQIATIFVGMNMAIRSFTPSITGIINLIPSDIGRNLRDFSSYVQYPNLMPDIGKVLATATPKESTIPHYDGRWFLVRILPYQKKGRVDGVGVTFIDVSDQVMAQRKIDDALTYSNGIIETVREPLLILDENLRVITANRSFYNTFKVNREETEKNFIYDLGNRQWDIPGLRRLLEDILPEQNAFQDYLVEHEFQTIGWRKMVLNARQIFQKGEGTQMILLAIEDITT